MREQPRIDAYAFGSIEIDGRAYTSAVIILPTGVQANWRRAPAKRIRSKRFLRVRIASGRA